MPGYSGRTPAWTRSHKPRKPFSKERKAHGDTIARGICGKFGAGTVGFRRRKRLEGFAKLAGIGLVIASLFFLLPSFQEHAGDHDSRRARIAKGLYQDALAEYHGGHYDFALRALDQAIAYDPGPTEYHKLKLLVMHTVCEEEDRYCFTVTFQPRN